MELTTEYNRFLHVALEVLLGRQVFIREITSLKLKTPAMPEHPFILVIEFYQFGDSEIYRAAYFMREMPGVTLPNEFNELIVASMHFRVMPFSTEGHSGAVIITKPRTHHEMIRCCIGTDCNNRTIKQQSRS